MPLPVPGRGRSILSDGRILDMPLEKTSCMECGLVSPLKPIDATAVTNVFEDSYALSAASPAADNARAVAYAEFLDATLPPAERVLEVGCGSGNLLKALENLWPTVAFLGVDPALSQGAADSERIKYRRSFCDDMATLVNGSTFDLIFSVNVIEHLPSPQSFFSLASDLLSPDGQLAVICPAAMPPNLELLFHDHLYTFSSDALSISASACGFVKTSGIDQLSRFGDFQLAIFSRAPNKSVNSLHIMRRDARGLAREREAYLHAWTTLDKTLLERINRNTKVAIFGAGQMAALLRVYASRLWERVELLLMDNISDAWYLGKPVLSYSSQKNLMTEYLVVVATAPGTQARVVERLTSDGIATVCFNDIIPN